MFIFTVRPFLGANQRSAPPEGHCFLSLHSTMLPLHCCLRANLSAGLDCHLNYGGQEEKGRHYQCNYGTGHFSGQQAVSPLPGLGAQAWLMGTWMSGSVTAERKAEHSTLQGRRFCQTTGTVLLKPASCRMLMLAVLKVPVEI